MGGAVTFTVGSLFSGVGGFELGFERAGFDVRWQVEVDPDCVSVLDRHWPDVRRYSDVRDVDPTELAAVDVVTFGSPCQDLSVAGHRRGLAGERSGLFYEATRIIAGLRPAPSFCVWENVPGALSSAGGRDFGAALDALADAGALDVAWRVLDAQWFGVPQRRRRIFTVGDLGGTRAASVLFESTRLSGHPAPGPEARQGSAGDAENGAGSGGVADLSPCLMANTDGTGARRDVGGPAYIPTIAAVSGTLTAAMETAGHNGQDDHTPGFLLPVAAPLTAGGHPNSNAPGRRQEDDENLVAYGVSENQRAECLLTPYARQLTAGGGKPGQGYAAVLMGVDWQQAGGSVEDGVPCLSTTRVPGDTGHPSRAVRRLMPIECERLMSWADDWTRWRADGAEITDGPRYRMIGNGVVSNVAQWIAERMKTALSENGRD